MPMSSYLRQLRTQVGSDLLLLPSVTGICFDEEGRVLLVRHAAGGTWVAPGGSIEPNEAPADAVVREMWEETGLLVEPTQVLGVYGGPAFSFSYPNGDRVAYVMTLFECRVIDGRAHPDGVETLELGYFSESDLANLKLSPWMEAVMPDVFGDLERAKFQAPTWQPPESSTR